MNYDVVVVGGGPGGLASAIKARELGLSVLLLDERDYLGGILPQCIHPGFGLHYFREDLTGPEFAYKLIEKMNLLDVDRVVEATVLDIGLKGGLKRIKYVSPEGIEYVNARSIIYAAGARERHRFEIGIVGDRTGGVYTAGEAQVLMDMYGVMPGKNVVIVGSGDVGLIMARRFALEGAKVKAVIELMPYPGGLARNIMQCLQDFDIPLYLSHSVIEIRGRGRVKKVRVVKMDQNLRPILGSEFGIECDTVIISAGLLPRIELLKKIGVEIDPATGGPAVDEFLESSLPGVFVVGNALLINDLVDYVVEQGETAAHSVRKYVDEELKTPRKTRITPGENVRFVVPQYLRYGENFVLYSRVKKPMENVGVRLKPEGLRRNYPVVKPAEMLRIQVREKVDGKVLTLEVK